MRLAEAGLVGQPQAGKFAFVDTLPEGFAQIFLQGLELHGREYSTRYITWLLS